MKHTNLTNDLLLDTDEDFTSLNEYNSQFYKINELLVVPKVAAGPVKVYTKEEVTAFEDSLRKQGKL